MLKFYSFFLLTLFVTASVFAQQYTISGKVTDARTGEALTGANVFIKSISTGAACNEDGKYSFKVNSGKYSVSCSYVGYEYQVIDVNVSKNTEVNFKLYEKEFSLSVTVIADRAKERETPVAFTNIDKKDVEMILGSQDIPMALNITPSVYATMQGGGAGDARVNVRGFNQRNVAIMINGVPINDMENGWVYWSNWDGVGDATSSIQVQRGLSAVNLATPSIGGTMNVITDPTSQKFGIKYKQEFGNDQFFKSTISANSGLIDGKWAFSAAGVRKVGDGLVDKTWTDAWAYYFGAAYNVDESNRLELYAIGAPQRHGQNSYKLNIGNYSYKLANDLSKNQLDYDPAALTKFKELGRKYNPNWNVVDPSYNGKQYWNGGTSERYASDFINERENYYHKPIINLNWYSQLTKDLSLYSTAYYSGGTGGGTGTYGSMVWNTQNVQRVADWNGTIARNIANKVNDISVSRGILRNSVNSQWTIGAISKAYYKVNENISTSVGIDWRTAEIEHYYEVRDLLGGEYFVDKNNEFDTTPEMQQKKLGDKVNYFNTNKVSWFGFYGQAEYNEDKITAYGMYGWSTIRYSFTDHFTKTEEGKEFRVFADWINGYQVKGGVSYRFTDMIDIYGNAGYVEKAPIFDNVIDDTDGSKAKDPENEKFTSFEGGLNFHSKDQKFALKVNYYNTLWKDRSFTKYVQSSSGDEGIVFLRGVKQRHSGIEFEAAFQPVSMVRLDGSISFGIWKYLRDVSSQYKSYTSSGNEVPLEANLYIKGLKVGDSPQTQASLALSLFPVEGLAAQLVMKSYRDHYAEFDPLTRTNKNDREQSWKMPASTIFDLHLKYDLPVSFEGVNFQVFAHIFNLFDAIYVQDATDNSQYNAYTANGFNHSADDAEVYLGLPRSFNLGISLTY